MNSTAATDGEFDFAPALATDGRGLWIALWVAVSTIETLVDYQQCVLRANACRVEGVLRVQAPRVAELMGLVGRSFGSPSCGGP